MSTTSIKSSDSPLMLPIVTIQPTFHTVISEVESGLIPFDDFWISCYKTSSPSVHAKVHISLDEINRDKVNMEPRDGDVEIEHHGDDNYSIACPTLGIPHTKVVLPKQQYADPERSNPRHPHRITAFDIAPDGSQFATGFLDGSVHLYPANPSSTGSSTINSTSRAHLSTVTSLQFFPSGRVLLSAGADFSMCILPADPPSPSPSGSTATARITPVRTLRGHTRSITSTAIISRGRNVLSSSQDGTVRLWDVSGGQQIHVMSAGKGKYVPVVGMSMGERGEGEAGRARPDGEELGEGTGLDGQVAVDEREVDTQDKVVFCALQDGSFEAFDLRSKQPVYRSSARTELKSTLSSITYSSSHNLLATGSLRGIVTLFDTRALSTPLTSFSRNTASVGDLAFTNTASSGEGVGLVVASGDGLPYVASVRPEGPAVLAELVGVDCDGVRAVRVDTGGEIWTAADDGVVRRYPR